MKLWKRKRARATSSSLWMILAPLVLFLACQTDLSALNLPIAGLIDRQTKSFDDVDFRMTSCEITPERSAVCRLLISNHFRDKKLEIGRSITIQDNLGTDYTVTAGGFGATPNRPQWSQTAVADSDYHLTVIATNLSTRATSVRAVVFSRLLVRSIQGPTIGYRDQVIFSSPPMRLAQLRQLPPTRSGEAVDSVGHAPETRYSTGAAPAPRAAADNDANAIGDNGWKVIGYWDYDGRDGQNFAANGLVLRDSPGAGLGQNWRSRLELKNHASLPIRARSLWPVKISVSLRKICADYPGYPSYFVMIDMPDDTADGVYQISKCRGD